MRVDCVVHKESQTWGRKDIHSRPQRTGNMKNYKLRCLCKSLLLPGERCVCMCVSCCFLHVCLSRLHIHCKYLCVVVVVCVFACGEEVNSYQSVFVTGMVIMAVFNNYAL